MYRITIGAAQQSLNVCRCDFLDNFAFLASPKFSTCSSPKMVRSPLRLSKLPNSLM
ncbi:hypothetical protein LguiA_029613 [Lonicera macranthoides]